LLLSADSLDPTIKAWDASTLEPRFTLAAHRSRMRALLATDARRSAIREIFRLGFASIAQEDGALTALWSPLDLSQPPTPTVLTAAVPLLVTLAGDASRPAGTLVTSRWRRRTFALAAGVILTAGTLFLARFAAEWFPPIDALAVWGDSLKLGAAMLVLITAVAAVRLRGTSGAHRKLLSWLGIGLIVAIAGGHGVVTILNGWLDTSAAEPHTVTVADKRVSGREKEVRVHSWRQPGTLEKLEVSSSLFDRIVPQQTRLIVVTKAGRLGHEWLVGLREAPAAPPRTATAAEVAEKYVGAIQARPDDDRILVQRGIEFERVRDYQKAFDDFTRAAALNPRNADAYAHLGWLHGVRGEHRESVVMLTRVIELRPSDGWAYYTRARGHERLGDRASTLSDLAKGCELGYANACLVQERLGGSR